MATPAQTLTFGGVRAESKRIVKAHSRHFLALTFLFLLPLSLSFSHILQTTLSQSGSNHHTHTHDRISLRHAPRLAATLEHALAYTLFAFLISLSAVATITYSTYHGFYGRPVKLAASVKSLARSFVPLLVTSITFKFLIVLVCAAFGLFLVTVIKGAEILGFEIDYDSGYFLGFCAVLSVALLVVLVHLKVNWALASVIVVVESKWGFEALRRSSYLIKGMRTTYLGLMLLFGAMVWLSVLVLSGTTSLEDVDINDVWSRLSFILPTAVGSACLTAFMLNSVVWNTVLYMYCKALHGELDLEIAQEYVSLPFDDDDAKGTSVLRVTRSPLHALNVVLPFGLMSSSS